MRTVRAHAERDPRVLLMMQHHELRGMTAPTLRALWRARRRIDASFRRDPLAQLLFLHILQQPRGIVHEFRRMNQYGILGRYLPEFGRIVGQMQHDLFHVYTGGPAHPDGAAGTCGASPCPSSRTSSRCAASSSAASSGTG